MESFTKKKNELVNTGFLDVLANFKISKNFGTPHIREIVKSGVLDLSANFKISKKIWYPPPIEGKL